MQIDLASIMIGIIIGSFFLNLDIRIPAGVSNWFKSWFAPRAKAVEAPQYVMGKPAAKPKAAVPKKPAAKAKAPAKKAAVKRK